MEAPAPFAAMDYDARYGVVRFHDVPSQMKSKAYLNCRQDASGIQTLQKTERFCTLA